MNFGEGVDPDKWNVDDFIGDVNEPAKQDLIRHINVTGTDEDRWNDNKIEVKNFFSDSFKFPIKLLSDFKLIPKLLYLRYFG